MDADVTHSHSISTNLNCTIFGEASDWSATPNTEQQRIADREMRVSCTARNMDYQEPTTTKPNFVSRQSLHVKVDEITMKLTGIRPGWSGLCRLVAY